MDACRFQLGARQAGDPLAIPAGNGLAFGIGFRTAVSGVHFALSVESATCFARGSRIRVDCTSRTSTFTLGMMKNPSISVIVPALNEEKLLPRMLGQFSRSLLERHNVELVVSDGGSTDRTLEIARAHADIVVENIPYAKQTISSGRNAGAHNSGGGIFVFLNADTFLKEPDKFFDRISEEITKPGTVAVTCAVEVYPEEEIWADRAFHGFYNWFFYMMNRVGMGMGRGECHVMKREVFAEVNGYADRIAAGEDYDMFRRLERLGRIRFLRDVVVFESPRRYRRFGYAYVTASWFLNFLSVFFMRRSILSEWKPVR
jgi:glycosyltransferase involved in cell wall biosynthesis